MWTLGAVESLPRPHVAPAAGRVGPETHGLAGLVHASRPWAFARLPSQPERVDRERTDLLASSTRPRSSGELDPGSPCPTAPTV